MGILFIPKEYYMEKDKYTKPNSVMILIVIVFVIFIIAAMLIVTGVFS